MFKTDDPEEFSALMGQIGPGSSALACGPGPFGVRVDAHHLSRTVMFTADCQRLGVETDLPREYLGVTIPLTGQFRAIGATVADRFAGDVAHILQPDRPFGFRVPLRARVLVVNFFQRPLDGFLNRLNGLPAEHGPGVGRSAGRLDLSRGVGAGFLRYAGFVMTEARNRRGGAFGSAAAAQEMETTLATLFLGALDKQGKNYLVRDRAKGSGAQRGRAEEFIEANFAEPLSLADVAEAAESPIRTLSRAFNERHGLGVMAYLRGRRLEKARAALHAADPGPGVVTRVALECGFGHLGRFSRDYRARFGELPSETVRRG